MDSSSSNVKFECNVCEQIFTKKIEFQSHQEEHRNEQISAWKLRENEFEQSGFQQKLKLSSDLFKLREKENQDAKCKCKKYCRIYHIKHNWKASLSQKLLLKMDSVRSENYSCKTCDQTFVKSDDLMKHVQDDHRRPNHSEGEKSGGNNSVIP